MQAEQGVCTIHLLIIAMAIRQCIANLPVRVSSVSSGHHAGRMWRNRGASNTHSTVFTAGTHQSCGPGRMGSSSRRSATTGSRSRRGRRRPCRRRRGRRRHRSPRRRTRRHRLWSPAKPLPPSALSTSCDRHHHRAKSADASTLSLGGRFPAGSVAVASVAVYQRSSRRPLAVLAATTSPPHTRHHQDDHHGNHAHPLTQRRRRAMPHTHTPGSTRQATNLWERALSRLSPFALISRGADSLRNDDMLTVGGGVTAQTLIHRSA